MNHAEATAFAKSFHPEAVAEAQDGYWSVVIPTMIEYATELGPEFEGTPAWEYKDSTQTLREGSDIPYSRPVEQHADAYNRDRAIYDCKVEATDRNRIAAGKRPISQIAYDVIRLMNEGGPDLAHETLPKEEIQDWLDNKFELNESDWKTINLFDEIYDEKWNPIDRDRDEC